MINRVVGYVFALLLCGPSVLAADGGVLVFGGTGQLGSEIVKDLVEAGEDVTVLARPTSNRARLDGLDVTYVIGDMLVDVDMERVFTSVPYRVVVDASNQAFDGDQTFYEESQRLVSKWAAFSNVGQVILHGAVGSGDSAKLLRIENAMEVQRTAIASKSVAEEILAESGVPYTIIRHLTMLPMDTNESGNARLTKDHTAIGAITRDGLARLTMDCLDNKSCFNIIFHAVDDDMDLSERVLNSWKMIVRPEYLSP